MYEIFVELLKERKITTYKISKETGIAQSVFSSWKTGVSTPKKDKLQKIADYFSVSVDYLIGATDNPIKNEDKPLLHNIYFEYMKEAQEKNIHPNDLRLAIDIIQKIRGEI